MNNVIFKTDKRTKFDPQFWTDWTTPLPDRWGGRSLCTLRNLKEIVRRMGIYFDFTEGREVAETVMYFIGIKNGGCLDYQMRRSVKEYAQAYGLLPHVYYYAGKRRKSPFAMDFLITLLILDALDECLELEYAQQ